MTKKKTTRGKGAPNEADLLRQYLNKDHLFRHGQMIVQRRAIVGDYFGGSIHALGVVIENSVSLFQFETGWAAIVVASVLGITFYAAVSAAEWATTRWQPSSRGATD